jgi:hypothetical protein
MLYRVHPPLSGIRIHNVSGIFFFVLYNDSMRSVINKKKKKKKGEKKDCYHHGVLLWRFMIYYICKEF